MLEEGWWPRVERARPMTEGDLTLGVHRRDARATGDPSGSFRTENSDHVSTDIRRDGYVK